LNVSFVVFASIGRHYNLLFGKKLVGYKTFFKPKFVRIHYIFLLVHQQPFARRIIWGNARISRTNGIVIQIN